MLGWRGEERKRGAMELNSEKMKEVL